MADVAYYASIEAHGLDAEQFIGIFSAVELAQQACVDDLKQRCDLTDVSLKWAGRDGSYSATFEGVVPVGWYSYPEVRYEVNAVEIDKRYEYVDHAEEADE